MKSIITLLVITAWCFIAVCAQVGVNTDFSNPSSSMVASRNSPHGFNHPVSHDIQNPRRRLHQDTRDGAAAVDSGEVTRFNGRFAFSADGDSRRHNTLEMRASHVNTHPRTGNMGGSSTPEVRNSAPVFTTFNSHLHSRPAHPSHGATNGELSHSTTAFTFSSPLLALETTRRNVDPTLLDVTVADAIAHAGPHAPDEEIILTPTRGNPHPTYTPGHKPKPVEDSTYHDTGNLRYMTAGTTSGRGNTVFAHTTNSNERERIPDDLRRILWADHTRVRV